MIPLRILDASAAACRHGHDIAPAWQWDGVTIWCCATCPTGTRCGICTVASWPAGFEAPGEPEPEPMPAQLALFEVAP